MSPCSARAALRDRPRRRGTRRPGPARDRSRRGTRARREPGRARSRADARCCPELPSGAAPRACSTSALRIASIGNRPPGTTRTPSTFWPTVHSGDVTSRTTPINHPMPGRMTPPTTRKRTASTSRVPRGGSDGASGRAACTISSGSPRSSSAFSTSASVASGRQPRVEVVTDLAHQLLTLATRQRAGGVVETPEVVVDERVDRGIHGVSFALFERMSSTASRKRCHSAVKSASARRPSLVMA